MNIKIYKINQPLRRLIPAHYPATLTLLFFRQSTPYTLLFEDFTFYILHAVSSASNTLIIDIYIVAL